MSDQKRARLKQWLESGEARLHPLTYPQRELWEASPAPPGDVSQHICCLIHAQGALTPRDSHGAMELVVERQEALRLSFLPGKERTLQMVRRNGEANIHFRDLPAAQNSPEGIEEVAREIFSQPFALLQGPLYRTEVLSRGRDSCVIALSIHHAVADGWTLGVFVQDLCAGYLQCKMGVKGALPPVPLTYTDWGAAERALWQPSRIDEHLNFWRGKLRGATRFWEGEVTGPLTRRVAGFSPELAEMARATAKRNGVTLFSTLLAAFQITLARWTGENDVTVGTPVANRTRQNVRETMGYFAGVVPLRGQVDPSRTFADALKSVHEETVDCFAHAMPFAELAQGLGEPQVPGRNPIFQVRFALQNHPIPDVTVPGLSAQLRMRSTGTPRLDLGCEITEIGDSLEVVWLYRGNRFCEADILELDSLYQRVLENACRSSESRTSHVMT